MGNITKSSSTLAKKTRKKLHCQVILLKTTNDYKIISDTFGKSLKYHKVFSSAMQANN